MSTKPTIFDTLDAPKPTASVEDHRHFLDSIGNSDSDLSSDEARSSDFEDVLPKSHLNGLNVTDDDEDDEEWEDAIEMGAPAPSILGPLPSGDLEISFDKPEPLGAFTTSHDKKKGPTKRERQIRTATHCMHVQFLLFHNLMRNSWICDKKLQAILVEHLPERMKKEVQTWKRNSGISSDAQYSNTSPKQGNQKNPVVKKRSKEGRNQRDWSNSAAQLGSDGITLTHGDSVLRLIRHLATYWRQRFRVTAPGLRKQGYKSLPELQKELASFHNDRHDLEQHGEIVSGIEGLRECARMCEGSRDVGAQLFTALIRGIGIEARLVASLQPIGFGWSKNEEATKGMKTQQKKSRESSPDSSDLFDFEAVESGARTATVSTFAKIPTTASKGRREQNRKRGKQPARRSNVPIELLEDTELSSVILLSGDETDTSVIDVTPPRIPSKSNMNYDRDMASPNYWTEVISPLTHKVYPVDAVVSATVATKAESLAYFEPRGAKAEKAKQVFAYVVGYSSDGTAKDVTTRYLKMRLWPGRTKGFRMPVEKVPIVDRKGKVKHYEQYDWFKTVMSGYSRSSHMRTALDDIEESSELKPVNREKKMSTEGGGTLQSYKQSAEFVLERFLRREEALLPGALPVRTFIAGRGGNAKEENVFRRKDVVACKTAESWHKEGRQVKEGEHPMKMVPVRAVTLTRKREVEVAERDTGEKLKQGLYAQDQTEWIIPPPIKDGVIPKNSYGNMDCFTPSMVPKGAVHIPLRGTVKVCKKLDIDYAEAVTGFEFGNKLAVPVITGVVVAAEYEHVVLDQWEKDEEERRIKEEGKREKMALAMWRKFLMGLRIVERVQEEYGGDANEHLRTEINPFTNNNKKRKNANTDEGAPRFNGITPANERGEEMQGGFLMEDEDMEIEDSESKLEKEGSNGMES
jgi:xeroderma pigmentosum group C-complementing protein